MDKIFDACFFSCDIGFVKNEKEYWEYIEEYLISNKINKSETIFYDDLIDNCIMANKFGIKAIQINSKQHIQEILVNEIKKMA